MNEVTPPTDRALIVAARALPPTEPGGSWEPDTLLPTADPAATAPPGACVTENTPGLKPVSNGTSGIVLNTMVHETGPIVSEYPQASCLDVAVPPIVAGTLVTCAWLLALACADPAYTPTPFGTARTEMAPEVSVACATYPSALVTVHWFL